MNRSTDKATPAGIPGLYSPRRPAITALVFLVLFLTGCASFPLVINDDAFKRTTGVTVNMWHTVLDSQLDNVRTSYHKEISGRNISDPEVTVVFVATVDPYYNNYQGESLSKDAYVMVDSALFPVSLSESSNVRMNKTSTIYDYPYFGYPHFFYFGPGAVIVRESNNRILTARFTLTPDMQKALIGASTYKLRFYTGETPVTLEATSHQLDALKKFLEYGQFVPAPKTK